MVSQSQLRWQFLKTSPFFWIGVVFLLDGIVFISVVFILSATQVAEPIFLTIFLIVGGVQAVLGLIFVGVARKRCNQRAQLLVEGVPTLAFVDEVIQDRAVRINGRHPFYLRYVFKDDWGQMQTGKSAYLPRDLEGRWSNGDPVLVLVDRDNPTHSVADVTGARPEDLADLRARWERSGGGRPLGPGQRDT